MLRSVPKHRTTLLLEACQQQDVPFPPDQPTDKPSYILDSASRTRRLINPPFPTVAAPSLPLPDRSTLESSSRPRFSFNRPKRPSSYLSRRVPHRLPVHQSVSFRDGLLLSRHRTRYGERPFTRTYDGRGASCRESRCCFRLARIQRREYFLLRHLRKSIQFHFCFGTEAVFF